MEQGIHVVPVDEYHLDPCPAPSLTQSIAKILLAKSPLHAWLKSPKLNPNFSLDEKTYEKEAAIGTAAHCYFLGRGRDITIMDHDSFRTKIAQEERDLCWAEGKVPLLRDHHETAKLMADAAHRQLRGVLDLDEMGGKSEVVAIAQHAGHWYRSLIDYLAGDGLAVVDMKTTRMSIAPHSIGAKLVADGVHVQAAMHEFILNQIFPQDAGRRRHMFIMQEQDEPYSVVLVRLTEEWMTMGRKQLAVADTIWRKCLDEDKWPSYPVGPMCPEFPGWVMTKWLEREEREFLEAPLDPDILMAG